MHDLPFPKPVRQQNGRLYWWRSALEKYKADSYGGVAKFDGPDALVPSAIVAKEFGVTRRTIGRYIFESPAKPTRETNYQTAKMRKARKTRA